jgi:hypothetical protein
LRASKGVGVTIESYEKVEKICRGQVHVPKKERRRKRIIIIIIIKIIIIIRNGAKTISLPNFVWET